MLRSCRLSSFRSRFVAHPLLQLAVGAVLLTGTASAQTATGGLRGFVKDDSGAILVGATVEASSRARIGGPAVEVTDAQGLYAFENLPPGDYTVVFSLQGFTTVRRENLRVEVGRTIQVDVQLQVGALEQSITVTGESPVVDAVHAGVTTNFNSEWLQSVPTARQSYFDVVTYAPSVKINQVPNDSRFVIFGSSSDQNSFQYEGVEISAVSNGGVWDFPSPDMMQEVEVKAVGVSAEYANFQGGVINIVLKSGSNQFHGLESAYWTPSSWVGNNTPAEQFPFHIDYNRQATAELGGPIAKDRVWFYGAVPWGMSQSSNVGVNPAYAHGGHNVKPFVKHVQVQPARSRRLHLGRQHLLLRRHRQPAGANRDADDRAWPQSRPRRSLHAHLRLDDALRAEGRGHLHPRQLHAVHRRLHDAGPLRFGHRIFAGQCHHRKPSGPQPHDDRRIADAQRRNLHHGHARHQGRRSERVRDAGHQHAHVLQRVVQRSERQTRSGDVP